MKKLSLNRQEFSRIVLDDCIYVDKTRQLYDIMNNGVSFFLSRPRRFGKSLLVNTFKEIFLCNQELFKDTWIINQIEWKSYPVIKLDFSMLNFRDLGLEKVLCEKLGEIARQYGIELKKGTASERFYELISELSQKSGPVVILVDEYDKPITDYIDDIPQADANRDKLKNFYSCLKGLDSAIRFLFITGVSKFSKVTIFSDLNHLTDLTLEPQYSALLGYTHEEILANFNEFLIDIEKKQKIGHYDLLSKIKAHYNGYSWDGETFVYNPFSIQRFFMAQRFQNFWFATGTATFLVKALKNAGKLPEQVSPLIVNSAFFDKFELANMDLLSLLFQTGYLTIKKIDYDLQEYTLAFPNGEVEYAFLNNFLEVWTNKVQSDLGSIEIAIHRSVREGKPEDFIRAFQSLFAGIPYDDFIQQHAIEAIFRSNIFIALKILGVRQQVEVHTNQGRVDAVIEGEQAVFIVEFKMGIAEDAMQQIHTKKYYEKFHTDKRKIFLLAIGIDEAERNIGGWLIEEIFTQR